MVKRIFIIVLIFIISLVTISFSYWYKSIATSDIEDNESVTIGLWLFSYNYNSNKDYKKGDIVIKDGKPYWVIRDVNSGNQYHDPSNPNTSFWGRVYYVELTEEYRSFNYYSRGQYVVHNGILYYYDFWGGQHIPNFSQNSPPSSRWKRSNLDKNKIWYKYKIYAEGDEVLYYEGSRFIGKYRCIKSFEIEKKPDSNPTIWQKIS